MTHWQECPTCAQDFDVDRWGWNDETAEAWRLAKAAPDMAARIERLETEKAAIAEIADHLINKLHVGTRYPGRINDIRWDVEKIAAILWRR